MKETIKDIERKYFEYAEIISAPKKYLHFYETPQHDGGPHIEYEGEELLFVHTEKGNRYSEKRSKNPEEILYWFMSELTFAMACEFEVNHRKEDQDFRIQLFARQEKLMSMINIKWGIEIKKKNDSNLLAGKK